MTTERNVVISIRLSDEEYAPFKGIIDSTDINRSAFFRALILNRVSQLPAKPKVTEDYRRCLFFMNKTSNNLNQIAHRLNSDNLKGILSESLYKKLLNTLTGIRDRLHGMAE